MIVRESIAVNFERGGDPKKTLGVGMRGKIQEWLMEYWFNISNATKSSLFRINDDLTIDILQGFFTTDWPGNFPDYIQFNEANCNFNIMGDVRRNTGDKNQMTSLRGCPRIVNGEFGCSRNNLKNLVGGPEFVKSHYACSLNPHIESFEGIAKFIGGDFACNNKSGLTEKDIPAGVEILGSPNVHYWADW
jgi:hypothetical protein